MIGKTISHYKIFSKIGSGGMGVVYKAEDTKLKRTVALKFLPPDLTRDSVAKQRFIQEAQSASTLDHNNICTIHEINETDNGQMFLSMACYEGMTLKERIEKEKISETEAINITTQIARGLAKAHEKGIVHRDIKPANIMITNDGVVKILDFGLAKLAGQTRLTKSGSTLGTVSYMSPEQARGDHVDQRTDIWSLGVVLFEMLTGQLPFKGEYEHAVIYSILNEEPEPLSNLKPDVSFGAVQIMEKALSKEPGERYQQVNVLLDDFKNLKEGIEIDSLPQKGKKIKKLKKGKPAKYFPISIGIVLLLIISFFMVKSFVFEEALGSNPTYIAVLPFENNTGDSKYDITCKSISDLLITKLENSKYLEVASWDQLTVLLKQTGNDSIEIGNIDRNTGFELCQAGRIGAMVTGSLTKMGNIFATDAKVLDVVTKEILNGASDQGNGIESILKKQIDALSKEISRGVNLSEKQIEENQQSVIEMTSSSLEAINSYTKGEEAQCRHQVDIARSYYEQAVEYDSTYALAYLGLVDIYKFSYGDEVKARQYYEKAKKYSGKLNRKDKLYFDRYKAGFEKGNRAKYFEITKKITEEFPNEKMPHVSLGWYYFEQNQVIKAINETQIVLDLNPNYEVALKNIGYFYTELGEYEQAIKYHKKLISVNSNSADAYDSMGDTYQRMGELDEAIKNHEEAVILKPDLESQLKIAYSYALKEDYPAAQKWISEFIHVSKRIEKKVTGYYLRALFHYFSGEHRQLFADFDSAAVIFKQSTNNKRFKAFNDYCIGLINYETGELENCQINFKSWFNSTPLSDHSSFIYNFQRGLLDLKSNQLDSSKAKLINLKPLLSKMEKKYYLDELKLKYELLHAEILLKENSFEKIINNRKKYLPPHYLNWIYFFRPVYLIRYNFPFTIDILARVYHKKGELDKAIEEYESLIAVDFETKALRLINPKYHYRLAKLYEEKGSKDKAIAEFEKFLDIWKNADEDLAEKIDAKTRLLQLKAEP